MNIKNIVKNNTARFSVPSQLGRLGNGHFITGTQSDHADALHSEGTGRPHVRESLRTVVRSMTEGACSQRGRMYYEVAVEGQPYRIRHSPSSSFVLDLSAFPLMQR